MKVGLLMSETRFSAGNRDVFGTIRLGKWDRLLMLMKKDFG